MRGFKSRIPGTIVEDTGRDTREERCAKPGCKGHATFRWRGAYDENHKPVIVTVCARCGTPWPASEADQ